MMVDQLTCKHNKDDSLGQSDKDRGEIESVAESTPHTN